MCKLCEYNWRVLLDEPVGKLGYWYEVSWLQELTATGDHMFQVLIYIEAVRPVVLIRERGTLAQVVGALPGRLAALSLVAT